MKKARIPSKENNQFKIDYAFPGLCSHCHSEIAEFYGSLPNGRAIISRLTPNFRMAEVLLDDGSRMTVSLCEDCFEGLNPDHMKYLMESEIKGWQKEVDECLATLEEDKKKSYMTDRAKRVIVQRMDKPLTEKQVKKIKPPDISKLDIRINKKEK